MGNIRDTFLATVQNSDLSKIVNELYRPGATVGDGGTASILVQAFNSGTSKHLVKVTGCIVSAVGMDLVFKNPVTGVVRECSVEEITSLGKLDITDMDVGTLGKEVPTEDLELYLRYRKDGALDHFTDTEKASICINRIIQVFWM